MIVEKITMKTLQVLLLIFCLQLSVSAQAHDVNAQPTEGISNKIRCTVCGMFVAKYPNWITQIHYDDLEQTKFFDGVKDMMVYYFNPEQFGGAPRESIKEIIVRDYYTLNWLSARDAFYVLGSDVYGPMGNELIPFSSEAAAKSFLTDHKGKDVFSFDQITEKYVETLRHGQMMR